MTIDQGPFNRFESAEEVREFIIQFAADVAETEQVSGKRKLPTGWPGFLNGMRGSAIGLVTEAWEVLTPEEAKALTPYFISVMQYLNR